MITTSEDNAATDELVMSITQRIATFTEQKVEKSRINFSTSR